MSTIWVTLNRAALTVPCYCRLLLCMLTSLLMNGRPLGCTLVVRVTVSSVMRRWRLTWFPWLPRDLCLAMRLLPLATGVVIR